MKHNTRGWYIFADGYEAWFNGLSAAEKRNLTKEHGAVIHFEPTE